MSLHLALAAALVSVVGFASHRASLCSVKAVAEVLTARTAHMLASFGKAVLWTSLVAGVIILFTGGVAAPGLTRSPGALVLIGGFVFGVGAGVNGGCSMSTLQRLANGELGMLMTLVGVVCGIAAWYLADIQIAHSGLTSLPSFWAGSSEWVLAALVLVAGWGVWELRRVLRNDGEIWPVLRQRLLAPTYRLSVAALLMGTASGVLFAWHGPWTYTNFLRAATGAWVGSGMAPTVEHAVLVSAFLGGMLLSAVQRGSFRVRISQPRALMTHFVGGGLMGVGGALIPGGNDTLLLVAIPSPSLVAVGAFMAMLAGIALTLGVMRLRTGAFHPIHCKDDRCR